MYAAPSGRHPIYYLMAVSRGLKVPVWSLIFPAEGINVIDHGCQYALGTCGESRLPLRRVYFPRQSSIFRDTPDRLRLKRASLSSSCMLITDQHRLVGPYRDLCPNVVRTDERTLYVRIFLGRPLLEAANYRK